MGVRELADVLGVHRVTVSRWLDRQGIRRRSRALCEEDVAIAVGLYDEGLPLHAVGSALGVSGNTVRRALLNGGAHLRPPLFATTGGA